MKQFSFTFLLLLLFTINNLLAQADTLHTLNNQTIAGDIKKLSRGIIKMETDYSDEDFLIEWKKIKSISSSKKFSIYLISGTRLLGTINGTKDSLVIKTQTITLIRNWTQIVEFQEFNDGIMDRFNASIGIGINISRANNLRQLNMRSSLGYLAKNWKGDTSFDAVFSEQDSIARTKRIDATIAYNYFFLSDWYVSASSDFLQNDEQKLKLRSTPRVGFGNYLIHTNRAYLTLSGGLSANIERYSGDDLNARNSTEIFVTAELNLFDFGDLSLLSNTNFFKNMNEEDRIRNDFKIDLKYDIFGSDFYIKIGYTLNYDSKPAEGATTTDYVIQSTFGWDL